MFYLNTIEQLLLFVEQLDQLKVCLPYSRLLTGILILAVFENLRWNSNKTSLFKKYFLHTKTTVKRDLLKRLCLANPKNGMKKYTCYIYDGKNNVHAA